MDRRDQIKSIISYEKYIMDNNIKSIEEINEKLENDGLKENTHLLKVCNQIMLSLQDSKNKKLRSNSLFIRS